MVAKYIWNEYKIQFFYSFNKQINIYFILLSNFILLISICILIILLHLQMISAKKMAFREEIRRKQIDEKFKKRRRQLLQQQKCSKIMQQAEEFILQFQSIVFNLGQLSNQSHYYIYQGLLDLKRLIMKRKKYIPTIIQQRYQIIQIISDILHNVNRSHGQLGSKQSIFQLIIDIFSILMNNYDIKSERIQKSNFIPAIVPYLVQNLQNKKSIENLLNFLGNAIKDSVSLSMIYKNQKIAKLVIQIINVSDIHIKDRAICQFLFFLRNYFEVVNNFDELDSNQLDLCIGASYGTIQRINELDLQNNQDEQLLEDSLKVFKQIINFQPNKRDISEIDFEKFIHIVETKNFPLNIKRQALHILDTVIYSENSDVLDEIIQKKKIFQRIWGVQDSLKFIVINMLANTALEPDYKKEIRIFLPRIKLEMNFFPLNKFICRFILNYFCSQQFLVEGILEQALIKELWNSTTDNREIIGLQAKIWLNLCKHQQVGRPPLRILQAVDIPEVQELLQFLDGGNQDSYMKP